MSSDTRKFKKLRISLTDTCNMACTYCVPVNHLDVERAQLQPALSVSFMVRIVKELNCELGLEKVRITGGEPLIYPGVVQLIYEIKKLGIKNIALTTNGFYLKSLALRLKAAGLQSINVSLDAMDEKVFAKMTRKKMFAQVIEGIEYANNLGFQLKINSVIVKGQNEDQILPLLKYGVENRIIVRFLELMKMGYLHHNYKDYFFSQNNILKRIGEEYGVNRKLRKVSSTANYWQLKNSDYEFGIIANESEPFCEDCDRLRLDSYGKIYGCISAKRGIKVLKKVKEKKRINNELKLALKQKQPLKFLGNTMSMRYIGG